MSFWSELRRRHVFLVAAVYVPVALAIIGLIVNIEGPLSLPDWTDTLVIILVIIGLPIALVLAWAFEMTPDGVRREQGPPLSPATDHPAAEAHSPRSPGDSSSYARSLAVLPFENLSPAADDAYFAPAIHDEILTQLAKISTLRVISRTSVMEYRNLTKNLRQIARELGVAAILEGGVQKVGDTVRINVQLIDAETDEHKWAESYDRKLTVENLLAIQREMAQSVAAALRGQFSPPDSDAFFGPEDHEGQSSLPTGSMRAYSLYLAGKHYLEDSDALNSLPIAVDMLEAAVREDASFADAFAQLSRAHTGMFRIGIDRTPKRRQLAEAALRKAVEIDPDNEEVLLARADAEDDDAVAIELYARLRHASPSDPVPLTRSARRHANTGRWSEAIELLGLAADLDPRNTQILFHKAQAHAFLRQYGEAEMLFDRIIELAPDEGPAHFLKHHVPLHRDGDVAPMKEAVAEMQANSSPYVGGIMWYKWLSAIYERDYDAAVRCIDERAWPDGIDYSQPGEFYSRDSFLGTAYRLAGNSTAATECFQKARTYISDQLSRAPDDFRLHIALGEALAGLGQADQASESASKALSLAPDGVLQSIARSDAIVRVLAPGGNTAIALDELDRYLAQPGLWSIEGLSPDPRLDPLRGDPRFDALVKKYQRIEH